MKKGIDTKLTRPRRAAMDALVAAARLEFEEVGYDHTNSNIIARRAGYAPQTFYRHFPDKLAIFLEVYEDWVREEGYVAAPDLTLDVLTRRIVDHHRKSRVFRRSLRALTVSDPRVAAARADARRSQVAEISLRNPAFARRPSSRQFADLLVVERLCDAVADDEFERLGVSNDEALAVVQDAMARLIEA